MIALSSDGQQSLTEYVVGRRALSLPEVCLHAEALIRDLPPGSEFTMKGLLSGVRLLGDERAKSGVVKHLQRRGLIDVAGITKQDQESRNNGFATLWRVVRKW